MHSQDETLPNLPHYVAAPPTTVDLDYADLPIMDLSKAATPSGRQELVCQVRDALLNHGLGFFYVINHGYTSAQTARMFDIADVPFTQVSDEEKNRYVANIKESGSFQGYKLRKYWVIDNGVRDQIELYSVNHDVTRRQHPEPIRPLIPEIEAFAKHNHYNVLHPIMRILALGLELPEETLVDMHKFSAVGETYVRFMKYYPRTEEEEVKAKNVWLKGHTDIGSITIVYSQPVAALQILTNDGTWKWVRHIENALIINSGDAIEFLSGGFYKPTIHRVVQPPEDQRNHARLGVYYFCMTDDDVKLVPLKESPVLQRVGITTRFDEKDAPTMEQWRKGRTTAYGQNGAKPTEKNLEEELVNGIPVMHYN